MRLGVVACGKLKLAHPAPAQDLYCSPLFRLSRRYVELTCDRWVILSALHFVVCPEEILEPYDLSLREFSAAARREWSASSNNILMGAFPWTTEFVLLAGQEYTGAVAGFPNVIQPMNGLGIGQRLAWLKQEIARLEVQG